MTSGRLGSRLGALAIVAALLAGCAPAMADGLAGPAGPVGGHQRTIILNAFGDPQATFGESRPYLRALADKVNRSADSAFCQNVFEGTISGQLVTVAITGTGSGNSGPCMQEMLTWYSPGIREVIWSGIAGATPAVGGLVDAAGQRRADATPVMVGDVCISAMSWDYDLHFSSVSDWAHRRTPRNRYGTSGGWWPMKNGNGSAAVPGFQSVQQFTVAPPALADEILAASRTVVWPALASGDRAKVRRFFPASQIRKVRTFDYTQCAEVSGDDFWHGVTEDRLARDYLAGLITASGLRSTPASAEDVVVFSAMESAAWMSVVARWNAHEDDDIAMAVVRAASNYDQVPLTAAGQAVPGPRGRPLNAMQDILIGFDSAGSQFAARTAALPVLAMLAARASAAS